MICKSLLVYLFYIAVIILNIEVNGQIENGCSAYKCKRTCMKTAATPGDNGFRLEFENSNEKYIPGETYKCK